MNTTTNEIFAYEADGSQDDYIKNGLVPINDIDLAALREHQEKDRLNALTYSDKRAATYPTIGNQLDMIYHAGSGGDEFQAAIKAVKDEFPKG
jgi:hypothetical protein